MTEQRKYITKGNLSDGAITITENDKVADHERMWREMELPVADLQARLKQIPADSLRNLAVRQRNRLAGTHQAPEVNQESREVGLSSVSQLAAARLIVATANPTLKRESAAFNELVALTLREANRHKS